MTGRGCDALIACWWRTATPSRLGADSIAGNCQLSKTAFTLKTPERGLMSEIGIFANHSEAQSGWRFCDSNQQVIPPIALCALLPLDGLQILGHIFQPHMA